MTPSREPHILLDKEGRIIVFLAGRPCGSDWDGVISRSSDALQRMRVKGIKSGAFKTEDLDHRRGRFLAVASGVSFGGGQMVGSTAYSMEPPHLLTHEIETWKPGTQQEAPSTS